MDTTNPVPDTVPDGSLNHTLFSYMRAILLANVAAALVGTFAQSLLQAQPTGVVPAFGDLQFTQPVGIYYPHDGSSRMYVVEQAGRIVSVDRNNPADTVCFLDIRSKVTTGGEMGLLGLAFEPDFRYNGRFYVNYTRIVDMEDRQQVQLVIERYQLPSHAAKLTEADTGTVILTIDKPHANHNGGQLAFGPDGYLYIGTGDGSKANDEQKSAQNLNSLLGKILRIDVRWNPRNTRYGIPHSNPFAEDTNGYRREIFAYGLRNPWRFSFDPVTWKLWGADVGQETWEEVNVIEQGGNYGWSRTEGFDCFPAGTTGCDTTGCTPPVWTYSHGPGGGISISGGFVYRGAMFQNLYGKYVYGDFGTGRIWALTYDPFTRAATNQLLMESELLISSFGVDELNEIYICSYTGGIYKLASAAGVHTPSSSSSEVALTSLETDRASSSITLSYRIAQPGMVRLALYDLSGREVMRVVQEPQPAGEHRIDVPGAGLANGYYLCSLVAGGRVVSRGVHVVH